jgi:hypothetical protein
MRAGLFSLLKAFPYSAKAPQALLGTCPVDASELQIADILLTKSKQMRCDC